MAKGLKGFQRGEVNSGGRPKGSINKRTLEWELIKESMFNRHIPKLNKLLDRLWAGDEEEQERAMKHTLNLLEYFAPKMARVDHSLNAGQQGVTGIKIEIINAPLPPAEGLDTAD